MRLHTLLDMRILLTYGASHSPTAERRKGSDNMTIQQLFRKVKTANEIAKLSESKSTFGVIVTVDDIYQTTEQGTITFTDWKDFDKSMREDWDKDFIENIYNAKIDSHNDCDYGLRHFIYCEGCIIEIQITEMRRF